MELTNEFTVDVPLEQAWAVLTDLERIAPCMPGAQLEEVDGDDYRGVVRVKVGPMTAEYRGKVQFLERDTGAHKAVLRAEGRETRGQGNASATITAQLEASGSATKVSVVTDLSISGRVAQFGRGVLADVSNKLLGQFVEQLEATVLGDGPPAAATEASATQEAVAEAPAAEEGADTPSPPAGGPTEATTTGAAVSEPATATTGTGDQRPADGRAPAPASEGAPVNLLRVVGPAFLKRLAPPAVLGIIFLAWRRRRRHRRRHD